ncbi:MAG TPA: hypothetical protein DCO77_02495, partial [Nitrospiraceae bacterium]|nr:hypothetical protein [Nitrospiraceae bacterium]
MIEKVSLTKNMTINPKDQATQKATDPSKSVHLSASAGSGKTRALKDRYLALLAELEGNRLHLDQAVAITFTDKAAAEIKERVMQDLPEDMLKKIIRGRQDLRISTIHSFCMNLLKRYPLDAGLPPDFGVLDARDQAYKIQKSIEDALEESDGDPGIMGPLKDYSADELIETIEFLISIRSRLKRMEIDAGGLEGLVRSLHRGMAMEEVEAEMQALIGSASWQRELQQMEQILKGQGDQYTACRGREHLLLSQEEDPFVAHKLAASLAPVYFTNEGTPRKNPLITKKAFLGNKRDDYEKAYVRVQEMLGQFRSLYARRAAGHEAISLLTLFHRAEERYQDAKLREGLLDFDDLEIYAYRLLQSPESPDILYWLDRKIFHFLIDEFQDTSDIQWAILDTLTDEFFAGQGTDKRMPPSLFVVGDEKQSIYRFREANYRLIENVRNKMEQNLPAGSFETLTLDRNFRSTPEIIGTTNLVFSALWGKAYTPSAAERSGQQGSVRLIEILAASSENIPSAPAEADVLAREIRNIVSGSTLIYEKKGDTWQQRPAGYGDCAVLIQSRTRLKEYEAALQKQGIPYRVVGGIGFYEEDEIQAVLNVLFFLWNRDDRLALAATLKSPLFGLTDGDISGLIPDSKDLLGSLRKHHPHIHALLDDWKRYANTEPLSGVIHRIIADTGAFIRFGRRNPQAIFNLDKLLDTAREFDGRGYTTLQDFVQWVKNIRAAEQREATADMNLPGFQGAVSIMTVHKAKGLEFPILFLPGMDQQPKSLSSGPLAIVEGEGNAMRMAARDGESPAYQELWSREQEELVREHQRLLYVAMTRARDHLVMIGTLAAGKKPFRQNAWLSYLHQAIPVHRPAENTPSCLITSAWPDWTTQILDLEHRGPGARPQEGREQTTVPVDSTAVLENIAPLRAQGQ